MRRFWFKFEIDKPTDVPPGISYGCGITAFNLDDAKAILLQKVFKSKSIKIKYEVTENINIDELDQDHVVLNMLPPSVRGVWFPVGY